MRTFLVLVLSGLMALAGCVATIAAVGEALTAWYMHQHGIPSRLDLSEDMGFGMLLFAGWMASTFTLPLWGYLGWRLAHRYLPGQSTPSGSVS
ncbi:hypothetical protein [Paracidovorax avenae]|uniref:hypothetical protein n=1 Tax=Paracidovorax avenae TaxID=80867 RepID=UPI00131477CB|nr:hypothetical protein [Paracidovorax avenae]